MTYKQVLKHYKTVKNLAAAIGITHQAVYGWKGKIPMNAQLKIEADTDGKLKATRQAR